jgi:hypothetical protein
MRGKRSLQNVVLDASPNAVVAVDSTGLIAYVNPQVETTFGYEPREILGQPIETLIPDRVRERHVGHRDAFIGHPVSRPMGMGLVLDGRRKDGSEFPVEISLSPVETDAGLQVYATIVDVTARKAAEYQLLQAQKLESIGRLAGGIAHDFNNVLFAIHGYAELLAQDLSPGNSANLDHELARRNVDAITQAAERAASLTSQLLAFSRRQVVTMEVLDLNVAVTALEPMLRRLIGANIRLVLGLDPDAGHIRADGGQIDQILVNLVVNGRDAMPSGGTVTIETANADVDQPHVHEHFGVVPGRYVVLTVTDSGEGMDRSTRDHVFEPFFTTKEVGKGTGLGLATTYGIVQQAGGHIWLFSEPGFGSSFKLYFPRVDAEVVARPVEKVSPGGMTGTILVVEDEPAVRDMTRQLLQRAGYTVTDVASAADAIAWTESTQPDLLLTDVIMADMSGIELAESMMDRFPEMVVLLLSGYLPETLDLERITARGAVFVAKPVTTNQLLHAVHRAMASARSEGEPG